MLTQVVLLEELYHSPALKTKHCKTNVEMSSNVGMAVRWLIPPQSSLQGDKSTREPGSRAITIAKGQGMLVSDLCISTL